MNNQLTDKQLGSRDRARQFAADNLAAWANRIDEEQTTPAEVLALMRKSGFLGAALPTEWGGGGLDCVSYGLMTEEIGKICSSVRSLMTVHNMAAQMIAKMGDPDQRKRWLPELCTAKKIIAFALTEPNVGSAPHMLGTQALDRGSTYVLNGTKKWITYGQIADFFLVFAQCEGNPAAFVVDRRSAGLSVQPIKDVIGARGSMLAELQFSDVTVPKLDQVGPLGAGLTFVANGALDHGRFSVAWGSTGIIQACLDACLLYAEQREQGGRKIREYQLIGQRLTNMLVAHTAARALCYRSACLRQEGDPRAVMETSIAKYYAAEAAVRAADDAVRIHGANGCGADYPVARYLRDATVMTIIEGTREIHQVSLANYAFQRPYLDG